MEDLHKKYLSQSIRTPRDRTFTIENLAISDSLSMTSRANDAKKDNSDGLAEQAPLCTAVTGSPVASSSYPNPHPAAEALSSSADGRDALPGQDVDSPTKSPSDTKLSSIFSFTPLAHASGSSTLSSTPITSAGLPVPIAACGSPIHVDTETSGRDGETQGCRSLYSVSTLPTVSSFPLSTMPTVSSFQTNYFPTTFALTQSPHANISPPGFLSIQGDSGYSSASQLQDQNLNTTPGYIPSSSIINSSNTAAVSSSLFVTADSTASTKTSARHTHFDRSLSSDPTSSPRKMRSLSPVRTSTTIDNQVTSAKSKGNIKKRILRQKTNTSRKDVDSRFVEEECETDEDTDDESERKRRKTRTTFSTTQLSALEEAYNINRYLSTTRRTQIATTTGLQEKQIKTWFQNRRMKEKREKKAEEVTQNSVAMPTGGIDATKLASLGLNGLFPPLPFIPSTQSHGREESEKENVTPKISLVLPSASFSKGVGPFDQCAGGKTALMHPYEYIGMLSHMSSCAPLSSPLLPGTALNGQWAAQSGHTMLLNRDPVSHEVGHWNMLVEKKSTQNGISAGSNKDNKEGSGESKTMDSSYASGARSFGENPNVTSVPSYAYYTPSPSSHLPSPLTGPRYTQFPFPPTPFGISSVLFPFSSLETLLPSTVSSPAQQAHSNSVASARTPSIDGGNTGGSLDHSQYFWPQPLYSRSYW